MPHPTHKCNNTLYDYAISQTPGRGPVPVPNINFTGPREILLELITNLNVNFIFVNTTHRTHKCTNTLYDYTIINY